MNTQGLKTLLLPVALLALCPGARAQEAAAAEGGRGELMLYERATQIGTVAARVFKDAKGRVVKTIYYAGGGIQAPYSEDMLREQSISVTTYDDFNCPVKAARYEPGMKLSYSTETRCRKGTATPHVSTGRDARGVKRSETRHDPEGGTRTSLYFDDAGERVVSIWGDTPADVDLAQGWGKEVAGFALGIAGGRERGRQSELSVWVTIKNISNREEGGLMVSPFAFELRDAGGNLIAPKADFGSQPDEGAACPAGEGRGVPFAGASQLLRSYHLGELYERLTPGAYSVTVRHCLSAKRRFLVSNTIPLEVTEQ